MLTIDSGLLTTWVTGILLPLFRVLGFIASVPILGHQAVPARVKIILGCAITLAVAPMATVGEIDLLSLQGALVIAQQITIGFAMGLVVRIVFAGIEMAGQVMGMTMGLGFAMFYDPQSQGQNMITSQYLYVIAGLVFLAIDGHLILIGALVESFTTLPISATGGLGFSAESVAKFGGEIFAIGCVLSLPIVSALLITNMALGVLSRTAPQLNLFGIGFPITIGIGFLMFALILPSLAQPIQGHFGNSLEFIRMLLRGGS